MKNMLCAPESESVPPKKRVIIKELVKGQEAATQLKVLLENPFGSEGSNFFSEELVAIVQRSFTQALSIINSSSADEVAHRNLLYSGENGSPVAGDCSQSRKISQKGGRGRYNRRRSAVTWTRLSCTTEDNHAWRKYGQKGILNSEFPRSYFRCSHKNDQGCRAIKQVQRDQENPDMYRTTYIGIHTCNATPNATHLATDLLNSDGDAKVPNVQDDHHISSPSLTIKQDFLKEDTPSDVTDHKLLLDNADNVYSCTDSQSLDMDFGVPSVDHFGTDFHF